ncbi:MAG: 23S rRNA (adenine(2030)-N(6))-methyltransferase RlmJ [Rhodobacterales bacterium]|nr:23S rRNA (adenine(2030)-N(6))-methyltransferase RlmJ [Rhodobacterales bacterium]
MLSYQHIYHAANLADVHKHGLLSWMLAYLTAKDKPLTYIESHAGRGLYDLGSPEAIKTGEAAAGIDRTAGWFPPDHPYTTTLTRVRAEHGPSAYPGSPLIAALLLRLTDRIHLAELHPREYAALDYALSPYGAHIHQRDGADLALSLTPPEPRRGMVLIDPSYEIKDDYLTVPSLVAKLHRKWPVGIITLWYPLLDGNPHAPMLRTLQAAVPDGFRHEVRFPPARPGHRMQGSGLFIVNAPYGTEPEAARLATHFAKLNKARP